MQNGVINIWRELIRVVCHCCLFILLFPLLMLITVFIIIVMSASILFLYMSHSSSSSSSSARRKNPPSRGAGCALQQECRRGSNHKAFREFIHHFYRCSLKVTNNSKLQVSFGTRSKKWRSTTTTNLHHHPHHNYQII